MAHKFGGGWTDKKLDVMRRYFAAYSQALKNQRFSKWYIDAFAGSGDRTDAKSADVNVGLFGDDGAELSETKEGSVRIALVIDPPFDRYVLIERSKERA